MSQFLQQFLAFSFILLLISCQPQKLIREEYQPGKTLSAPLQVAKGDNVVYKASIDIFRNTLSGLFIIVNDDSIFKVGFISEMGIKFFDMVIRKDAYDVVYCMEALNRKQVLNSIARSLQYLLEDPEKHNGEFFSDRDNNIFYRVKDNNGWNRKYFLEDSRVKRIAGRRLLRNKVFLEVSYNDNEQPENIIFLQRGMRMRIELTKL